MVVVLPRPLLRDQGRRNTKGRMRQRGSKLIQDQRVLDQANCELNQYK